MTGMEGAVAAVLGCGVIGSSWIEAFLAAGLNVRAWDPVAPLPRARYAAALDAKSLVVCATPAEAVDGCVFVQECGPEGLETKRGLFDAIAPALAPDAIVASSTSTLQPSALQAGCPFAARLLVGHPFNPPHLLPLVEVVGGQQTDPDVIARAMAFYSALGKHPIQLRRERPGHLANRLQAALWREAIDAVASGQASVADVDACVRLALGPRWALMGPFATFNLGGGAGGLAHFLEHLGPAFEGLWDDARRPEVSDTLRIDLVAAVEDGLAGRTRGEWAAWRDHKLRQVLAIAQDDAA